MAMQVPKALADRNGTTLAVGVFLAFVFQATLLPIAQFLSDKVVGSDTAGEVAVSPSFVDGVVAPLVTLVFAVVVLEVVLWLMAAMKKS